MNQDKSMARTMLSYMLIAFLCSLIILAGLYPNKPSSFMGWVCLYLFSLPIYYILEVGGEKVFNNKMTKRIGSFGRVIFGIIVIGLLGTFLIVLMPKIEPYLNQW
jgi:hypothetical protein